MHTGDEPQFSNQDNSDHVPMISGRSTQIIVSARGAYVVGNIFELLRLMDASQQTAFLQVVSEFAMGLIRPVFSLVDPNLFEYETIQEAMDWLQLTPIEAVLEHNRINVVGSARMLARYAINFSQSYPAPSGLYRVAVDSQIHHWHVEIAWALIQHQPIPAVPAFDAYSLESVFMDRKRMMREGNERSVDLQKYQQGNLGLLIMRMDAAQRQRFKHEILDMARYYAKKAVPRLGGYNAIKEWFDQAENWLTLRGRPTADELAKVLRDMEKYRRKDVNFLAVHEWILAFTDEPSQNLFPLTAAQHAARSARHGAVAWDTNPKSTHTKWGGDGSGAEWGAYCWQIDKALQILHER